MDLWKLSGNDWAAEVSGMRVGEAGSRIGLIDISFSDSAMCGLDDPDGGPVDWWAHRLTHVQYMEESSIPKESSFANSIGTLNGNDL